MTDKQKALEAFVVAMARRERHQNDGDSPYFAARDLLAAIEAENKPEPESIVERLCALEDCQVPPWDITRFKNLVRDLERLAEDIRRVSKSPLAEVAKNVTGPGRMARVEILLLFEKWGHEIDGKP